MKEGVAVVDDKCTFCGACVDVCPVSAITLEKEEKAVTIDLTAFKDVWIFVEQRIWQVSGVSSSFLGRQKLADAIGCKLCGMLFGDQETVAKFAPEAIALWRRKRSTPWRALCLKNTAHNPMQGLPWTSSGSTNLRSFFRSDDPGTGFCRNSRNDPGVRAHRGLYGTGNRSRNEIPQTDPSGLRGKYHGDDP